MNKEEFISDFKSEMKVGFLYANESLQHLKQKKISNDNEPVSYTHLTLPTRDEV